MGWRFVSAVGNLKAAREETWEAARPGSRHRVSQAWHENNPAPHNVGLAGPAVSQQSQYTVTAHAPDNVGLPGHVRTGLFRRPYSVVLVCLRGPFQQTGRPK